MCPWTGCDGGSAAGSLRKALRPAGRHQWARPFGAAFVLLLLALLPSQALAQANWEPLARRLAGDGFDPAAVNALFSRPEVRFDPLVMARKMNALLEVKLSQGKPKAEAPEIYARYLNPVLIMRARAFMESNGRFLREARQRYGVPEEFITALLLVETKLGSNLGGKSALSTLASMALAADYSLVAPHIERRDLSPAMADWLRRRTAQKAAWAYKELKALLVYAKAAGTDPAGIPGSVYGAIGLCQFMPSNAVRYGEDFDGDGRVDLFDPGDAILSTARFLAVNGWRANLPREKQLAVLYRYNQSHRYTRTVMAVAERLRGAAGPLGLW